MKAGDASPVLEPTNLSLERLVGSEIVGIGGKIGLMRVLQLYFVSDTGGGLDKQVGATGLLLAKRSFWLVGALRTGDTVILSLYTSLETASTLVKQGVVLCLVFVTSTLLALTLVVANTQLIVGVELCGNAQDVGVPRWGRTVALPPIVLLAGVAILAHGVTQLLITGFPKKTFNPWPVRPLEAAVFPSTKKSFRDCQDTLMIQ